MAQSSISEKPREGRGRFLDMMYRSKLLVSLPCDCVVVSAHAPKPVVAGWRLPLIGMLLAHFCNVGFSMFLTVPSQDPCVW
jgi:hypothetical protein